MPFASKELQELAAAFQRRGMTRHLEALRRRAWREEHVREWFRYLRLPPHAGDYPLLPRGAPCPRCSAWSANRSATRTVVVISFPRGWGERCLECGAVWLHEERF